jgi:hypothetical protein
MTNQNQKAGQNIELLIPYATGIHFLPLCETQHKAVADDKRKWLRLRSPLTRTEAKG